MAQGCSLLGVRVRPASAGERGQWEQAVGAERSAGGNGAMAPRHGPSGLERLQMLLLVVE